MGDTGGAGSGPGGDGGTGPGRIKRLLRRTDKQMAMAGMRAQPDNPSGGPGDPMVPDGPNPGS
jgi:hypothetical protein